MVKFFMTKRINKRSLFLVCFWSLYLINTCHFYSPDQFEILPIYIPNYDIRSRSIFLLWRFMKRRRIFLVQFTSKFEMCFVNFMSHLFSCVHHNLLWTVVLKLFRNRSIQKMKKEEERSRLKLNFDLVSQLGGISYLQIKLKKSQTCFDLLLPIPSRLGHSLSGTSSLLFDLTCWKVLCEYLAL